MKNLQFRITTFQYRAQQNVDAYTMTAASEAFAKRWFYKVCHSRMANVLGDALFPYNVNFNLVFEEKDESVGLIIVDSKIEYAIKCHKIVLSEDHEYRTYRGYGITFFDGDIYITENGRVIHHKDCGDVDLATTEENGIFDSIYEHLDKIEHEKGKIKNE